jgi:hypothetical protein
MPGYDKIPPLKERILTPIRWAVSLVMMAIPFLLVALLNKSCAERRMQRKAARTWEKVERLCRENPNDPQVKDICAMGGIKKTD